MSAGRSVDSEDGGRRGLNPAGAPSETIRRGEELYRVLAEQLPSVAVLVFDHDLRLLVAVGEALMSYGLGDVEAEGRLMREAMAAETYLSLEKMCRRALAGTRQMIEQASPDGERWFRVITKPLEEANGRVWAGLVLAQDITDLRAREEELRRQGKRLADLAHYDDLTRLANRILFRDRLEHALARAQRDGREVAVLFLDLDRFKNVNDTLGHGAGDQLLQTVAGLLRSGTRSADTVARLGGDEFAVLIEGIQDDGDVARALDRILAPFEDPVAIAGEELLVFVSVGVASGPRDGKTADELIVAADRAMYLAKGAGGGGHRFFDARMQERSRERLRMEAELHHALRRDELVLHYQPAVDLRSGQVISVEALVRWNHPARGLLPPHEFIPLAELTGLTAHITEWVLRRACEQVQAWHVAGVPALRVAVNSCSRAVKGGLSTLVRDALQRADVTADSLEIEITERFMGADDAVADDMLAEIKHLGVSIAVDDFGTGYSSLARLRSFPVDVIKIDRSFIAELDETAAVTRTIIALGRDLGLLVIAEGIETESQLQWLRRAQCDAVSGFLISRPRPSEHLTPWLLQRAEALEQYAATASRGEAASDPGRC